VAVLKIVLVVVAEMVVEEKNFVAIAVVLQFSVVDKTELHRFVETSN
jgi:hypothetical protein